MNFLFIGIGRTTRVSASAENAATALNAEQEAAVAVNPYGRTSRRGVVLNLAHRGDSGDHRVARTAGLNPIAAVARLVYHRGPAVRRHTRRWRRPRRTFARHLLDAVELYCRRAAPHGLSSLAAPAVPGKLAVPHPRHRHWRP